MRILSGRVARLCLLLCLLIPTYLQAAGRIEGVVTDVRSGQPVAGTLVELRGVALFGIFLPVDGVDAVLTDAQGRFQMEAIPNGGSYALRATPPAPLLPVIWPSHICVAGPDCRPGWASGNISIADGSDLDVDFTVTTPGSVSGRVVRADNQQPVEGQQVTAFWYSGGTRPSVNAQTNSQGLYRIDGVPPGTYRVVSATGTYQQAVFADPVEVDADWIRSGVDFQLVLAPSGQISGSVREIGMENVPLGVSVRAMRFNGIGWSFQRSAQIPPGASEFTISGLPAGTYALATSGSSTSPEFGHRMYAHELYDNVQCYQDSCDDSQMSEGQPIELAEHQAIAGYHFVLNPAASVSGCITSRQTGLPLVGIRVVVHHRDPAFSFITQVAFSETGPDGCYKIDYLRSFTYHTGFESLARVKTFNSRGFRDQIYPDFECLPGACNLLGGLAVHIPRDADIEGVNFSLDAGPSLSGRVLSAIGGVGLQGLEIGLWNQSGMQVAGGGLEKILTNSEGQFETPALAPGTYFLTAYVHSGQYQGRHLYGVPTRPGEPTPPVTSGIPLVITSDSAPPSFDFVLDPEAVFRDGFESD